MPKLTFRKKKIQNYLDSSSFRFYTWNEKSKSYKRINGKKFDKKKIFDKTNREIVKVFFDDDKIIIRRSKSLRYKAPKSGWRRMFRSKFKRGEGKEGYGYFYRKDILEFYNLYLSNILWFVNMTHKMKKNSYAQIYLELATDGKRIPYSTKAFPYRRMLLSEFKLILEQIQQRLDTKYKVEGERIYVRVLCYNFYTVRFERKHEKSSSIEPD